MNPSLNQALAHLPHGPEFRFLDRLTALTPGQHGEGEYQIRGDEIFLRGHFPNHPIFPGVLLAEAGAQLAGVVAQSEASQPPLADLRLAAVNRLRILGAVEPGAILHLRAAVTGRMGGLIQAQIEAWAGETKVMEGMIVLSGQIPTATEAHPSSTFQ